MNHLIIEKIIEDAFEKARENYPSNAHTTLSNYIEEQSKPRISYKTAARAYKKYIEKEEMDWSPNPESIENFCKFLGCEGYQDYVEKNPKGNIEIKEQKIKNKPNNKNDIPEVRGPNQNPKEGRKRATRKSRENIKWALLLTIVLSSISVFYLYKNINKLNNKKDSEAFTQCMAWADNHYEKIDCALKLHPKYGTKLEPYLPEKSTMKKIEVNASTGFFSEVTGKPLVWYYKTNKGTLEYFNSPGLHPVNGETLKKITEGMIEKYVPKHISQSDSFLQNRKPEDKSGTISINKKDYNLGILLLNQNEFDVEAASKIIDTYFKGNTHINLKNKEIYNTDFVTKFKPNSSIKYGNQVIDIDTLCLGQTTYYFSNSARNKDFITCNLSISFQLYVKENQIWVQKKEKQLSITGSGYSKNEAKINTIKKIYYE